MNPIPARHHHSEFSLGIAWRPNPSRSRSVPDPVPGMYVSASFANEGEAHSLADGVLLDPDAVIAILSRALGERGRQTAIALNKAAETARQDRVKRLEAAVNRLQKELDDTRGALAKAEYVPVLLPGVEEGRHPASD